MKVNNLLANNIKSVSCDIPANVSIGIGGLSGSGKSTFCSAISEESLKRMVTLLPKSEYRFLFGDKIVSNYSAQKIEDMPLVFYLGKAGFASNPRSTVGTHTGIFKEIRQRFANEFGLASEYFSFNNSITWCEQCKGRGSTAGNTCKLCNGTRYSSKVLDYKIKTKLKAQTIIEINSMTAEDLLKIVEDLNITDTKKNILINMAKLNIGYLSLDRVMSTLSGGETVRLLLAEFMAQCINSLIIIDEVSIGLDRNSLVNVLNEISILGTSNQVWLIDHSDIVLKSTDSHLYFGPKSGKDGGNIVEESPRPLPIYRDIINEQPDDYYIFRGMSKRNINIEELKIPKNRITTITGESGCGKSTLVNECMVPYFMKNYKSVKCEVIGQDRNQSITSRSTVATFLDIKKKLDKYGEDIFSMEISDLRNHIKKEKKILSKLDMLLELGLGYLSLDRKVQTLSTGEFQCLHLVSKLSENVNDEMLLIFDEPSKGLSQNILNLLMKMMETVLDDSKKTILIIEHNDYILKCSDYIIDFGKRTKEDVSLLNVISGTEWISKCFLNVVPPKLSSKLDVSKINGINVINNDVENVFEDYERKLKGGLLKKLSSTAQWIYGDYDTDIVEPMIVIDLESNIYSKNTFLYEISGMINYLITESRTTKIADFDFFSEDNLCECCKGTGHIQTIDFNTVVQDESKGLWDGLLKEEAMVALKKYNYSKIKFLFKEIKKETNYDLSDAYSKMNEEEKNIFLYGYWKSSFYDKTKKTQRKWQGIIHLVTKYMRSSKSKLKNEMAESKNNIICPMCNGTILKHNHSLVIKNSTDIREYIISTMKKVKNDFDGIKIVDEISKIVGQDKNLNDDVSTFTKIEQVRLKIKEIEFSNLIGYKVVLKNAAPFMGWISSDLKHIGEKNSVILLDYDGMNETKDTMLKKFFAKGKVKPTSYAYEIIGYKKINTELNKLRKQNPCPFCNGTKVLREESIYEGVDVTKTSCHSCQETGISKTGLKKLVEGFSAEKWMLGTLGEIKEDIPDCISDISPLKKISELNKKQIYNVNKYMEEYKC